MFHVEHFYLTFLCAALCSYSAGAAEFSDESPALPSAVALGGAANAEETRLTNSALYLLLLGEDERAASLLRSAQSKGAQSPLTNVALLLCTQDDTERRETLRTLNEHFDENALTPPEAFYTKSFLALLAGDIATAANEFREHAERFRGDRLAACWDILLHHYTDKSAEDRTKTRARAEELLNRCKDDGTAAFVCALTDEFAEHGQVSTMALHAATFAVESLPKEIAAKRLYGHLLFLSGDIEKARSMFHMARAQSEKQSYHWYAAGLYEATCNSVLGHTREALQLRREMNACAGVPERPQTRAEILARWEVNSLPLRVLVTRAEKFDLSDIKAAALAATPKHLPDTADAALCYRNTLVQILMARYHHRIGQTARAGKELEAASHTLEQLREKKPESHERFLLSCHTRACEACQTALHLVRAEVFPTTSAIWREHAAESRRSASLLLPPVIPQGRAGE